MTDIAAVYHSLREKMIRYLERRGCFDPEGVVDEALYRAFVKPGYNGEKFPNIETFAFGVLKKVYYEWLRRTSRDAPLEDRAAASDSRDPEACEDMQRAMERLPAEDREFLEKFYVEGMAAKELAPLYKLTAEGVRSRAYRLKNKLRRWLRGRPSGPQKRETNRVRLPYPTGGRDSRLCASER